MKKWKSIIFLILILFQVKNLYTADINYVSFYKVRINLLSSAASAILSIENNEDFLTYRIISVEGNPFKWGASIDKIWLLQKEQDVALGNTAKIVVDYAINYSSFRKKLNFILTNEGTVEIYGISIRGEKLIIHISNLGEKRKKFSINLSEHEGVVPVNSLIENVRPRNLVLAFYYIWYNSIALWKSPYLNDHPQELYISSDPFAISRHIHQAKLSGIDGFIASWWGPYSKTDDNFKLLLQEAEKENFLVSIYLEIMTKNEQGESISQPPEIIFNWLRYLLLEYGKRDAFLKVEGKPVIFIYNSHLVNLDTWERIFNKLRKENLNALYIATVGSNQQMNILDVFDGLHFYNILSLIRSNEELNLLEKGYEKISKIVSYYPLLIDNKKNKFWAATIQPGYDDHLLPDRASPIIGRNLGETYRSTFEAAINSNAYWIIITTWNEWWEHTYIEPSIKYKDKYLKLTKEFSSIFKKINSNEEGKEHIANRISLSDLR